MSRKELNIILGGPQGAGLETSVQILTSTFACSGYGVIADREYFSNIRGKHSYIHMKISSIELPQALTYPVQILGAMDAETIFTHFKDLEEGGYLIYDKSTDNKTLNQIPSMESQLKERLRIKFNTLGINGTINSIIKYLKKTGRVNIVELNYPAILSKLREKYVLSAPQASRYISGILVGAVAGLIGLEEESITFGIEKRFKGREKLIEHNVFLVKYVSDIIKRKYGTPFKLETSKLKHSEIMIVSGNDIIAMGKIIGGLRYQSYYPITPAADESFLLEAFEKIEVEGESLAGLVIFQTEDELAAITSAIGAALAGARAATATSGPGFSLMIEGIGWAGINETPVVITYYQRGGPSTGMPTRGSQSDLLSTLFASHGEFPKIVIASGDHLEAFYDAIEALNLAERYQTPVIHLIDKFLANSLATIPIPNISEIKIERGKIQFKPEEYVRFSLDEPISPRAFLGSNVIMWHTGSEHDEKGHNIEDPINRVKMYEKRMKKIEIANEEIAPERRAIYYGSREADFLLIGWGFTKGVSLEAIKKLERLGVKGAYLHLRMFSPFPSNYVKSIIEKFDKDKVIAIEHNYLAQAGKIITYNIGVKLRKFILKYTGRPMYTHEVVEAINQILKGEDKVVLTYGA